jgi:uncharacterized membrane protein YbhN (UPF0104 family)
MSSVESTYHSIRFIHHLLHIEVVHLSLLEWIGLGCIIWLVLWAVGGIVPIILVLVAGDVGDILLDI